MLLTLTTKCSFQFNHQLLKQVEGRTMESPLSVTLAEIHMIRMDNDIVIPLKPTFYRRFIDDIINRRKKNIPDELDNYCWNIKLTIESSPTKFFDTQLVNLNRNKSLRKTKQITRSMVLKHPWTLQQKCN